MRFCKEDRSKEEFPRVRERSRLQQKAEPGCAIENKRTRFSKQGGACSQDRTPYSGIGLLGCTTRNQSGDPRSYRKRGNPFEGTHCVPGPAWRTPDLGLRKSRLSFLGLIQLNRGHWDPCTALAYEQQAVERRLGDCTLLRPGGNTGATKETGFANSQPNVDASV